jgi:hypothetical protein
MRWRRMIGIDPHPFAAIPKRPRHHTRFHRIVAQIRAEGGRKKFRTGRGGSKP